MAYKRYKYDLCKTDHLHIQAESPGNGRIQRSKLDRKIRTSGPRPPHHLGGDKRTKVACQGPWWRRCVRLQSTVTNKALMGSTPEAEISDLKGQTGHQ